MTKYNNVIKLSKQKTNELFSYIREDNFKYALIFRLLYVYARNPYEVLTLRKSSVTHFTISFTLSCGTSYNYRLHRDVKRDLLDYIESTYLPNDDDYIFIDVYDNVDVHTKRLNYYLNKKINQLNKQYYFRCPKLTTTDFKILRGQHLYLDGVDDRLIHKFSHGSNIQLTRKNIKLNELKKLKFKCETVDDILEKRCYTDLNIFRIEDYCDDHLLFTVADDTGNMSCVIGIVDGGIVFVDGDRVLGDRVLGFDGDVLVDCLLCLRVGDFRVVDGLKFIRN